MVQRGKICIIINNITRMAILHDRKKREKLKEALQRISLHPSTYFADIDDTIELNYGILFLKKHYYKYCKYIIHRRTGFVKP